MDELVRAARLAPSVGPFTLRRLFLRARIFASGTYTADDVRAALPGIHEELQEILQPEDFRQASQAIDALVSRERGTTAS
jgi:hypothetical protein